MVNQQNSNASSPRSRVNRCGTDDAEITALQGIGNERRAFCKKRHTPAWLTSRRTHDMLH